MKHFIQPSDIPNALHLVERGIFHKANPYASSPIGRHKTICLLFFNSSLRTRLSTQKAALNLGMQVMVMNVSSEGWQLEFGEKVVMNSNKAEHIKEAAAVVGTYADIIGVRSFPGLVDKKLDYSEEVIENFRKYAGVPILNLESAIRHPCQSLADLITIEERKTKARPKVVLTWAPHVKALPQAVANSFAEWMQLTSYDFVICNPPEFNLSEEFTGKTLVTSNQEEAFEGADFIYAKNWSSLNPYGSLFSGYENWQITAEKMALTDNAKFMHCLPVRRNVVVADEVLDSPQSIVIEQAGNRVWAAQAAIEFLLS